MNRSFTASFPVILALLLPASSAAEELELDAGEQVSDAGERAPDAGEHVPDGGRTWASCAEHLPQGATKPKLEEAFPNRGLSGYATYLEITITHGKGETVLPAGFRVQSGSDEAKALEHAGFVLPDLDGGAGATVATEPGQDSSTTKVSIPFVALPKKPGRTEMELPPIPIAIARASGELMTVCTAPHKVLIEDPIANEVDPKVKPNPPPRPQREEWVAARFAATYGPIGAGIALLSAWLIRRHMRRPKPQPVVPLKLPWIAALEELEAIRASTLLAEGRTDEYFDRVSDCVRKYLGARYGFDGLESTTDEMRAFLKRVRPAVKELDRIGRFLADCDLVKFARVVPTEGECLDVLDRGEAIVRLTTPPAAVRDARLQEGAPL
jgi:hypothetical protein